MIGFYNRDEKCLQRGTDWAFKYNLGSIYLTTNSDMCHLQHKLIGFLTQMKSVYSAVRTGALNITWVQSI